MNIVSIWTAVPSGKISGARESKVQREPLDMSDTLDPRLGWVEAFVAANIAGSYDRARELTGCSASTVKRNVEKLEIWLRRILVLSGDQTELSPCGEKFLPIACDILQIFDNHVVGFRSRTGGVLNLQKSKKSVLRLRQIDDFVELCSSNGLKDAAYDMDRNPEVVRDSILGIQKALGLKLTVGRKMTHLSVAGNAFEPVAQKISEALHSFREYIRDRSIFLIPQNYKILVGSVYRRQRQLKSMISMIEGSSRVTRTRKRQLAEAKEALALFDRISIELDAVDFTKDRDGISRLCTEAVRLLGLK